MKVLLLNGSPKANGNTAVALHEMVDIFNKEGIETEVIHVGNKDIRGCVACGQCSKLGHCVFNDLVNEVATKFAEADGLVVGSPVLLCLRKRNTCRAFDAPVLQHSVR